MIWWSTVQVAELASCKCRGRLLPWRDLYSTRLSLGHAHVTKFECSCTQVKLGCLRLFYIMVCLFDSGKCLTPFPVFTNSYKNAMMCLL